MSYDAVASYGCDPNQVAPARRWTHQALSQRLGDGTADDVVQDAVLVVSELVTNAIRAACSQVSVGIAVEPDAVRVGVTDDADGIPQQLDASEFDTAGRGLQIVAAVARQWGVRPIGMDGRPAKEVWARLSLGSDAREP
jgi:anti-sigma regulatory factor (Ser/Thr protein kinase)